MKVMVYDVGGTEIKYSVMDEQLRSTHAGTVPTPLDSREHFYQVIYELFAPHKDEVEGIAMSLPGFINTKLGKCNGGGTQRFNIGANIAGDISALCGCPVQLGNDGKCAAMAELKMGALRGCENASVFLIGTGVGGGLIVHGKLLEGQHFTAGEYSFVRSDCDNWADPCSTMALRCSTTGLLWKYRTRKGMKEEPLNGRQFFAAYEAGDAAAAETLDWFSMEIARQITNLTILLDLERVAIGGGISAQPILLEKINAALDTIYANTSEFFDPALPRAEVVRCHFGIEANQVGALCYYLEAMKTE